MFKRLVKGGLPPADKMLKVMKSVQIVQVDSLPLEQLGIRTTQSDLEKMKSPGEKPMTYVLVQYKEAVVLAVLENKAIVAICREAGFKG